MKTGKDIVLLRHYVSAQRTCGALYLAPDDPMLPLSPEGKGWLTWTLEPKFDEAKDRVTGSNTAIEDGRYRYTVQKHARYVQPVLRIANVPGRGGILMHSGMNEHDSRGCILPGLSRTGPQGTLMESRPAMRRILEAVTGISATSEQIGYAGWLEIRDVSA